MYNTHFHFQSFPLVILSINRKTKLHEMVNIIHKMFLILMKRDPFRITHRSKIKKNNLLDRDDRIIGILKYMLFYL